MTTEHGNNHQKLADSNDTNASELVGSISWLREVHELGHIKAQQLSSTEVAWDIAKSGPHAIEYQQTSIAILLSVEHYQQLVDTFSTLKKLAADSVLAKKPKEFQQLYALLTSKDSATAADSLFSASDSDLANNHKPGLTEQQTKKS